MTQHVTFRASPVLVARIDRLAEARKVSRSAAIKAAIVEATVPEHATAIADEHEVLVLLTEAARGGSVSAMKVSLAHHRLPRPAAVDPIFRELDEWRPGAILRTRFATGLDELGARVEGCLWPRTSRPIPPVVGCSAGSEVRAAGRRPRVGVRSR